MTLKYGREKIEIFLAQKFLAAQKVLTESKIVKKFCKEFEFSYPWQK